MLSIVIVIFYIPNALQLKVILLVKAFKVIIEQICVVTVEAGHAT